VTNRPHYPSRHRPEFLAAHESGHVVSYVVLGIPLAYVTIVGSGLMPLAHTQPVDLSQATRCQQELINTSGVITGLRANYWRVATLGVMELLIASADGQFEVCGMRSGQTSRMDRGNLVDAPADLAIIVERFGNRLDAAAEANSFWQDCETFIDSVDTAVVSVGEHLLQAGELGGSQVEKLVRQAMSGKTPWMPHLVSE
jgi:hypothetical protein